jgi:uncharacterized protein (DUF4415 family)
VIFDNIESLKWGTERKKSGRGLGKKPALVHVSLRIPKNVLDYFDQHYPYTKQTKMREILTDFINKELTNETTK